MFLFISVRFSFWAGLTASVLLEVPLTDKDVFLLLTRGAFL